MTFFGLMDASLKRVRYYNPDLNIDLLWLDEEGVVNDELRWEATHVRTALVARIADIGRSTIVSVQQDSRLTPRLAVKQNASQPSAMGAAVAMVEALVCSYHGSGGRLGCGHKQAMQAISLLASTNFDTATDLFFDLVDRFCTHNRSSGNPGPHAATYFNDFSLRMLQTYDQTFVKLLSKHWDSRNSSGTINLENPVARIKTLRRDYEFRDNRLLTRVKSFGSRRKCSAMFVDSVEVLRSLQRRRATEALKSRISTSGIRSHSFGGLTDATSRKSKDTTLTSSDSGDSSDQRLEITYESALLKTPEVKVRKPDRHIHFDIAEEPIGTPSKNTERNNGPIESLSGEGCG